MGHDNFKIPNPNLKMTSDYVCEDENGIEELLENAI